MNKRLLWVAAIFLVINVFIMNGDILLWDEDESAYAGFAEKMLTSGNWLVPDFQWSEIHRKTPLHFWEIALSYKIFGVNTFALRFSSAIAGLLTVFFLFLFGKNLWGKEVAGLGAVVLASSLFVPNIAKVAVTDSTLLLFQTTAILALLNYLKSPNWKWNLLLWLSIALGILTKGPPIIIVTGGLWVFLFFTNKNHRKNLIQTHPWIWGIFALVPLFVWGYMAWQTDDGVFITWLTDWYILKRFGATAVTSRWTGPPGYHLAVILGSFLPWLAFLPVAIYDVFKKAFQKDKTVLPIIGWLVFGWIFYEFMASKLPAYSLSVHPIIAILIAQTALNYPNKYERSIKTIGILNLILIFLIALALLLVGWHFYEGEGFKKGMSVAIVIWATSFGTMVGLYAKQQKLYLWSTALSGLFFTFLAWQILVPFIEKEKAVTKSVATYIHENYEKGSTIHYNLSGANTLPSLAFYISDDYILKEQGYLQHIDSAYVKDSTAIFLFDDETMVKFQDFRTSWKQDSISQKKGFEGRLINRGRGGTYWVFDGKK